MSEAHARIAREAGDISCRRFVMNDVVSDPCWVEENSSNTRSKSNCQPDDRQSYHKQSFWWQVCNISFIKNGLPADFSYTTAANGRAFSTLWKRVAATYSKTSFSLRFLNSILWACSIS